MSDAVTFPRIFTTAVNEDGFTCDDCAESKCAVCGHEPCPACLDDCDHPDCLVWQEDNEGRLGGHKTHDCQFTACEKHR